MAVNRIDIWLVWMYYPLEKCLCRELAFRLTLICLSKVDICGLGTYITGEVKPTESL